MALLRWPLLVGCCCCWILASTGDGIQPEEEEEEEQEKEGLCPHRCECFDDFQTVDCAKRAMTSLPLLFNQTKRLSVEGNQLQTIAVESFRLTADIESIVLTENSLVLINTIIFCHLHHLTELDLSRNLIRVFDVETSCGAESLEELDLSHNLLTVLPTALSFFAPRLEVLDLSFNNLESIPFDSSYARLDALRFLDLSSNHLDDIRAKDLRPLRSTPLRTLCLNNCKTKRMDGDALTGFRNMTTLSLSNSRLNETALVKILQTISAPGLLTQLDLGRTQLTSASVPLLGRFHSLSLLDLSNCNIRLVDPLLFRYLPELESLHIEGGQLALLPEVDSLQNLRELFVQRNLLDSVDLDRLRIIETVDLSWNRLRLLPANWMTSSEMIQDVNLSHNYVTSVDHKAFDLSNVVYIVDLSYNRLEVFWSFGNLRVRKLILCHNSISRIARGAFDSHFDTLTELDLGWNRIEDIEEATFTSTLTALHYLNLAHNRLGIALAEGALREMLSSMIFLKVLDLSYNDIAFVKTQQFIHLRQLSSIYLQGNRIGHLGDTSLLDINLVTKVILSNNLLETVDMGVVAQLEFLQEIDLSGNPFLCDCHLEPFLSWINSTDVRIVSIYDQPPRYSCASPAAAGGDDDDDGHQNSRHPPPPPSTNLSLSLFETNCSEPSGGGEGAGTGDRRSQQTTLLVGLISVTTFVFVALSLCWTQNNCKRWEYFGRFRSQIRYREVSSAHSNDSHL